MPTVDIALPVYNEAHVVAASVRRLHQYLSSGFPFAWRITVVDNASTDETFAIATAVAAELGDAVVVRRLTVKGRGLALRAAWTESDADVVAYMDIDLSTGLDALLPLVAPLLSGHSDVAVGSRLARNSAVERGPRRELISRCYNALLRTVFTTTFHDAQCGFKAMRSTAARQVVPAIEDNGWFFDTELLLLADHNGLRIHEVPVDWVDDIDSRVRVAATIWRDLCGVARMAWRILRGRGQIAGVDARRPVVNEMGRQVVTFSVIGAISTLVSLVMFLRLRQPLGSVRAHLVALTATTAANAWANRRFTFRRRGPQARLRQLTLTIGMYLATALASSLALAALRGSALVESLVIAASWSAATVLRFAVLRGWVFHGPS